MFTVYANILNLIILIVPTAGRNTARIELLVKHLKCVPPFLKNNLEQVDFLFESLTLDLVILFG